MWKIPGGTFGGNAKIRLKGANKPEPKKEEQKANEQTFEEAYLAFIEQLKKEQK